MCYPADESLAALVDELRSTSRAFDTLWPWAGVAAAQEDQAVLSHPDVGEPAMVSVGQIGPG
jgi:hypothetical protein